VGAAEIRQPRDNHTGVGDRLVKGCEMDARIAGRVMGEGRQRVAIGLRNILSRDSATRSRQRRLGRRGRHLHGPNRGARGYAFRTGLPRLFENVDGFRKPEASRKPCGVASLRIKVRSVSVQAYRALGTTHVLVTTATVGARFRARCRRNSQPLPPSCGFPSPRRSSASVHLWARCPANTPSC
jgi:hypothetical protein